MIATGSLHFCTFWNITGLLEACKLHTLVGSMHDEHLSWPALTETHMTPPDK